MILEICCADTESVGAALNGGADRIELCSALEAGGITPSAGLIGQALWRSRRKLSPAAVNILVRPRPGDFLYSDKELTLCVEDTVFGVGAGVDGIVFGALTSDGDVDEYACARILEAIAKSKEAGQTVTTTFHRAFDLCRDPFAALETIIRLGFDRILTSGQAPGAEEGIPLLKRLADEAGDRISIMPGAGVTPSNIRRIVDETGVREVHASAKEPVESRMIFRRDGVGMGSGDSGEYIRFGTSAGIVADLKNALDCIDKQILNKYHDTSSEP